MKTADLKSCILRVTAFKQPNFCQNLGGNYKQAFPLTLHKPHERGGVCCEQMRRPCPSQSSARARGHRSQAHARAVERGSGTSLSGGPCVPRRPRGTPVGAPRGPRVPGASALAPSLRDRRVHAGSGLLSPRGLRAGPRAPGGCDAAHGVATSGRHPRTGSWGRKGGPRPLLPRTRSPGREPGADRLTSGSRSASDTNPDRRQEEHLPTRRAPAATRPSHREKTLQLEPTPSWP